MSSGTDWVAVGATGTIFAALVALIAVVVAADQLKNLNNALRVNSLLALLQVEAEMNARADKLDEFNLQVMREILTATGDPNIPLLQAMDGRKQALFENYANSIDRLAFCILKNCFIDEQISEKDWRLEYKVFLDRFVEQHPGLFGPDTSYDNIWKLHQKWQQPAEEGYC
jgi:hypothetical protein